MLRLLVNSCCCCRRSSSLVYQRRPTMFEFTHTFQPKESDYCSLFLSCTRMQDLYQVMQKKPHLFQRILSKGYITSRPAIPGAFKWWRSLRSAPMFISLKSGNVSTHYFPISCRRWLQELGNPFWWFPGSFLSLCHFEKFSKAKRQTGINLHGIKEYWEKHPLGIRVLYVISAQLRPVAFPAWSSSHKIMKQLPYLSTTFSPKSIICRFFHRFSANVLFLQTYSLMVRTITRTISFFRVSASAFKECKFLWKWRECFWNFTTIVLNSRFSSRMEICSPVLFWRPSSKKLRVPWLWNLTLRRGSGIIAEPFGKGSSSMTVDLKRSIAGITVLSSSKTFSVDLERNFIASLSVRYVPYAELLTDP